MNQGICSILHESSEWRLIALLLECPSDEWRVQVKSLSEEIDHPQLKQAAASALQEATHSLYHTTFGPGGPAAAREVSYLQTIQPGLLLHELKEFYKAFAYEYTLEEPPDHVAVEIGFMSYLKMKEAFARSNGWAEQAEVSAQAGRQFLQRHLRPLCSALAANLVQSEVEYLKGTARCISDRLALAGPDV